MQSSAKSLIVDLMFLQISLTYARNRSGPNTVPCGTPDIILTCSDNCCATVTLRVTQREFPYPYDYPTVSRRDRSFRKQPIMWNEVESFRKVHYNGV
jgi:hypothetical protein